MQTQVTLCRSIGQVSRSHAQRPTPGITWILHCVHKKRPPPLFYFSNNSVKNQPILMIFGRLNPEKILHRHLVHLPNLPVYCSHFTLGNRKKSFSAVLFIHTSDYLCYFRKKNCYPPYPPHLKNVTTLPCKM